MSAPDPDEVLSIRQVMEALGVSRNTVYARIKDGSLRATKQSGLFYIRRRWVNEFLGEDEPQSA
jgi:excisionase family DNA binding protein